MENKGPSLLECFEKAPLLLMEGALGERLKREYGLQFDEQVAMAALVRSSDGRRALSALWREYAAIGRQAGVPFLATTPTRRANRERMARAGFSADLMVALPREFGLRLFGGCCGTDGGHLRELVRQLGKEPPFAENSVPTGRTGS